MGGWYHRPRRRGSGCFGGIYVTIVLIIILINFLFSFVGSSFNAVVQGGSVWYDEEKFQDYADTQYAAEFSRSSAYEDNLLIVFLVDEGHYDFNYIAWVGDHIDTDISYMLGGNESELGQAMNSFINENTYKYSLDSDLAQVMREITAKIEALRLDSSFTCAENHVQVTSHLTNCSDLNLTESTVNEALAAFTDTTGIPAVIVVEDMEEVFGKSKPMGSSMLTIVVVLTAIVLVVNFIRRRRRQSFDDDYGSDTYDRN